MPFKSKKQWKKFFVDPDLRPMAEEWAHKTKTEFKDLPTKVKKKKDKKKKKTKKSAMEALDDLTRILYSKF